MSAPDIDFRRIHPLAGSRNTGFEELCCQLAKLEPASDGDEFSRKGQGADAGVECYWRYSDGTESGWQAKYCFSWTNNLRQQLNRSISKALAAHPDLEEYVVCLPFDLPDSRESNRKSAKQKWNDWCVKWKDKTKEQGRVLTITLWGRNELHSRLTLDNPENSGCLHYWFGLEPLTKEFFRHQFDKAEASLGSRYTPETNVELAIQQDLLAFLRSIPLQETVDNWLNGINKWSHSALDAIRVTGANGAEVHSRSMVQAIGDLTLSLGSIPREPDQPFPVKAWRSNVTRCLTIAKQSLRWAYDLPHSEHPNENAKSRRAWEQPELEGLIEVLFDMEEALSSERWKLVNANAVLLQGSAGVGKSHLLADIVEHQLKAEKPAVLLLGAKFVDNEIWPQIRDQLDRPSEEQFKHFLGMLNAAAQVTGVKAVLCVDAINERNGLDVWPERLAAFLNDIGTFRHIGVILSCRSAYVSHLIPDDVGDDQLLRVNHPGFAMNGGDAARAYLDMRGMVRPGAPNLVPEFENPLFLKTYCDSLERENKTGLPSGLRGITTIFNYYSEAVVGSLNKRMRLDPHQEIVPIALNGLVELIVSSGTGTLSKQDAIDHFESVLPSKGNLNRSLLSQLTSEGILTVESVRNEDGSSNEIVRFTFERISDHMIAAHLLRKHLNVNNPSSSFCAGQPLNKLVFGTRNFRRAGVIGALAIQLPEVAGLEILELGNSQSTVVRRAFIESLLWRKQSQFTEKTLKLVLDHCTPSECNEILISISTEPANQFNARFLHKTLVNLNMPQRDERWSVYLARRGLQGPINTLIAWAIESDLGHIEKERTYLAGTTLAWFLATSHREVRDKATKGLTNILSRDISLAISLLCDFRDVDDLYVLERVLAAGYGAVLQRQNDETLAEFAQVVFDVIFADGKPPANTLLRDHALGIIEYAGAQGLLQESFDLARARPPYTSAWPIEPVPDEVIAGYTEDHGKGPVRDDIVHSTVLDGDFARYVVDRAIRYWSPATIGTARLPSFNDTYTDWREEFLTAATKRQRRALDLFERAANKARNLPIHETTPEIKQLVEAEEALKQVMTTREWEGFRAHTKFSPWHLPSTAWLQDTTAHFNTYWARRWICKRAHDLGWTSERFSNFDGSIENWGRNEHRVERIGKKYQWLAFQELLALLADNLVFLGNQWIDEHDTQPVYSGARQTHSRDIDPSLLVTGTYYDGWREWDKRWWVPFNPKFRDMQPHERHAWLHSDRDIINSIDLIDLCDPNTGRRWLALSGFAKWSGSGLQAGKKIRQRETWFRLTCLIVRRKHQDRLIDHFRGRILTNPSLLPDHQPPEDFYLGEFLWHPGMRDVADWSSQNALRDYPVPVRGATVDYICESGGYDYSIDKTVRVETPAPWLAKKMMLRLQSGRALTYVGPDGRKMFFDPSVSEPGPAAALVDQEAFLKILDDENLSAIWLISGEKNIFGGNHPHSGFGGCMRHTGIYSFDGKALRRLFHTDKQHPSRQQLREFFGQEPIPAGIESRD